MKQRNITLSFKKQHGFTLLELVVVVIIISILIIYALDRLLKLEVEAERASVQQVIGGIQSGLAMKIAEHIARDDIAGLHELIGTNPMDRLSETPTNYKGELADTDKQVTGQTWYYSTTDKALVYRVKNSDYFETNLTGPKRLRLRIEPSYEDRNKNGRFDKQDQINGLRLQAIDEYRWSNEPLNIDNFAEK